MPIARHDQPTYAVDCDRCDATAEHDDGTYALFVSEDAANQWARDNGWRSSEHDQLLCTDCGIDAANEQEQFDEITAAMGFAMGADTP
jgi:hypothetical protein